MSVRTGVYIHAHVRFVKTIIMVEAFVMKGLLNHLSAYKLKVGSDSILYKSTMDQFMITFISSLISVMLLLITTLLFNFNFAVTK